MSDEPRIGGHRDLIKANGVYTARGAFGVPYMKMDVNTRVNVQTVQWYTCREQFHSYAVKNNVTDFYYTCDPDKQNDVAHFMYHIERWLKLENKSWFKYTEKNNILWVETEKWWTINQMRYQFFTICLRAALNWRRQNNSDLRYTLLQCPYAGSTVEAVDRFLAGYTWYTGTVVGWDKQFAGRLNSNIKPTTGELKRLLVLPDYERKRRIEEAAYFKWEAAGRPGGDSYHFYADAAREHDQREAA